jgi:transcription antitermination factor NusG
MAVAYLIEPEAEQMTGGDSTAEGSGSRGFLPWFALQVRARHEIGIADYLSNKGYEQFLPLYKCRKRWSDRIKEVDLPLFPGYLFCRFNPQNRLPILKTPGVVRIVGNSQSPIPVCDKEIESLQILVASGLPNQACAFLQAGDRVRIEAGPLRGAEGLFVRFKGNCRLILSVTLLQRAVAIEIDSAYVSTLRPAWSPPVESPELRPAPLV